MRKFVAVLVAVFVASLSLMGTASAQDAETHIGTLEADPASVPEAGEYSITANGSGWLPDTSLILTTCTYPGDTLVFGEATEEEISAALTETLTGFLENCDLAAALPTDVDGDGNFTVELTAEVADNFVLGAGALDQSQGGATWIPIVAAEAISEEAEAADIVTTAVESGEFPTLVAAVEAAGLVETLQGEGPFTVFAPTEDAFAAALEATGLSAEALLGQTELLTSILTYHVVAGNVLAADVVGLDGESVATVNGEEVAISVDGDTVMVNDATVVATDIVASNGVIHVIDSVLLPSEVVALLAGGEEEAAEEEAAEEEPAEDLADTGVETGLLAVIGTAVLGAGVMVAREARRHS